MRRALEGQQALAALRAHAERRSLAPQQLVFGVEQRVFLQPAAVQRRGAERENLRACLVGTVEAKLDLALERPIALTVPYSLRTVKNCSWPPRSTSRNAVPPDGTWRQRAAGFLRRAHRLAVDAQ